MLKKFSSLFFIGLFFLSMASAQKTAPSAYSRFGIGEVNPGALVRNIGMGGTGVGNPHSEYLNLMNPALLSNNRFGNLDSTNKYTIFDAAITLQNRMQKTSTASQSSGGLNLFYFNFAFPLSSRWTTAIGLTPFSTAYHRFTTQETVANDTNNTLVTKSYNTEGGINKFYLSNGIDLTKTLSAGVDVSFLFGNINREALSQLPPFDAADKFGYNDIISYSGFGIKPGLAYRKGISGKDVFFNAGVTYDFYALMQARRTREILSVNSLGGPISSTPSPDSVIKVKLPEGLNFGISFDKPNVWTIAADVSYYKWSQYYDFGNSNTSLFNDSYKISLGGEFRAGKKKGNDNVKEKNTETRKMDFRLGASYAKTPLTINGKQLDDISFSLGVAIPTGKSQREIKNFILPKLNLALQVGQMGTTSNNLILERYVKLYAGVVINDKWFRKRKIE